jgi:hypothetical protein
VLPVVSAPHRLLVTLVLCNAIATEVKPVVGIWLQADAASSGCCGMPPFCLIQGLEKESLRFPVQALPIFLDRLADPVTAVIVSIIVVLVFGEPSIVEYYRLHDGHRCLFALAASCLAVLSGLALSLGIGRSLLLQVKSFRRRSARLMGWLLGHMQHGLSSC